MDRENDYIAIMLQSLEKKCKVLEQIISENERQRVAVSSNRLDSEVFEETLENKDQAIQELALLDQGFESLYKRVQEIFAEQSGKMKYQQEIQQMKRWIEQITEKSLEIERQEKANERLVLQKLSTERQEIQQAKNVRKVAADYYKSMNKVNFIDPQFMDQKK